MQTTETACTFPESCAAHFYEFVDTLAIFAMVGQCRDYPQSNTVTDADAEACIAQRHE